MTDLQQAMGAAEQAVNLTSDDHPDRVVHLYSFGVSLESRWERTAEKADLERAGNLYLRAWRCEHSSPFHRVLAASRAVNALGLLGNLESAAGLAQDAIDLLPMVTSSSFERGDQQYALSHFSGLAASACSIFLRVN
jgi:hypothetical protein